MMVDTVKLLVRELLADPTISAHVGNKVYGGVLPTDVEPAFLVVRAVSRSMTAPPSSAWWDNTTTIDIHSVDPIESFQIASDAAACVTALEDVYPEGVVASVRLRDILTVEDGAFTPTRSRNIVTVSITARDN